VEGRALRVRYACVTCGRLGAREMFTATPRRPTPQGLKYFLTCTRTNRRPRRPNPHPVKGLYFILDKSLPEGG
jgi:hypothetical protein